jgi:rhodanese-related sulfurtransferase
MKNTKILLIFSALFVFITACTGKQINDEVITTVDVKKAKELLKEDIQLVDVRTPKEYEEGHIENALNIDVTDDSFVKNIQQLNKEKPVMVYCRSGHRSARAAQILKEQGFKKIYNLDGGFMAWESQE